MHILLRCPKKYDQLAKGMGVNNLNLGAKCRAKCEFIQVANSRKETNY